MHCDLWPEDLFTARNCFWLNFQFVNEDLSLAHVDTNNQVILHKYFYDLVNHRNSSKLDDVEKIDLQKVLCNELFVLFIIDQCSSSLVQLIMSRDTAQGYLHPHCGNVVFCNVYFSA